MGSFLTNAIGAGNGFQPRDNPATLQQFGSGIAGSQDAFNQNYANQGWLSGQLQNQANGSGPNPAQIQLQQGTNRAIKQGTGMIASQKGINPALAARLSSQNAANMSQQAAGQGAMMGAQQQIAGQNNLANLYGQMGNQQNSMYSTLQNAQSAQNNMLTGYSANQNNVGAGVSGQNAQSGQAIFGGIFNGAGVLGGQGMAMGGEVRHQYADGGPVLSSWGLSNQPVSMESGPQSLAGKYLSANNGTPKSGKGMMGGRFFGHKNAGSPEQSDEAAQEGYLDANAQLGVAGADNVETTMPAVGGASEIGGGGEALGGAGALGGGAAAEGGGAGIAALAANKGGEIPRMATGGPINNNIGNTYGYNQMNPTAWGHVGAGINQSNLAMLRGGGMQRGGLMRPQAQAVATPAPQQPMAGMLGGLGNTAQAPARPQQAMPFNAINPMGRSYDSGGTVPGQAKISGDSLKNDKVPAMLSPKEIVLPRSVTMAPDAPEKAKAFVAAIMARHGKSLPRKAS